MVTMTRPSSPLSEQTNPRNEMRKTIRIRNGQFKPNMKFQMSFPRVAILVLMMPLLANTATPQIPNPLDYPQRQEWIRAGFQDNEGRQWSRMRIQINEAKGWKAMGITPSQASSLKSKGMDPQEVQLWIKAGHSYDFIMDNVRGDFRTNNAKVKDFQELQRWGKIGVKNPSEIFTLEEYGDHPLTISQAEEWHKFGFSVLPGQYEKNYSTSVWWYLDEGLTPKEARKQRGDKVKGSKDRKEDQDRERFWSDLEHFFTGLFTLIISVGGCIKVIPMVKRHVDNM